MSTVMKGVVKWFNNAKGFGFIEHTDGKDVFVHYSVIKDDGYRSLKDGEEVEYEITEGPKGYHATSVVRINNPKKPKAPGLSEQVETTIITMEGTETTQITPEPPQANEQTNQSRS